MTSSSDQSGHVMSFNNLETAIPLETLSEINSSPHRAQRLSTSSFESTSNAGEQSDGVTVRHNSVDGIARTPSDQERDHSSIRNKSTGGIRERHVEEGSTIHRPELHGRPHCTVRRVLWGKHVFMITISGTLGIGFYVRSGIILRLGGPLALVLSFAILMFLAWGVMQCITEMLAAWPVPGALIEFVRTFVDPDLAVTVGIAYWFTYSIAFAAIITAIAGEAQYWSKSNGGSQKGIDGVVLFFILPLFLVGINTLGVRLYAMWEIVGGFLKLILLGTILILMVAINLGAGHEGALGTKYWNGNLATFDRAAETSWGPAFLYSLSVASFAFVGVEIVAATALEARIQPAEPRSRTYPSARRHVAVDETVRFTGVWVSIMLGCIYVLGAMLLSFNISSDDGRLPRLSWLAPRLSNNTGTWQQTSGFVSVAETSGIPGLGGFVTFGLLVTALGAANTFLYVASRTLFGLTKDLDNRSPSWIVRRLAYFGKTTRLRVPVRAVVASCCFCWVPFLYLSPSNTVGTNISTIVDVLVETGSVGCIMVWAVECLAFIRFHQCRQMHKQQFEIHPEDSIKRLASRFHDSYPYRSHGQPFTAYASLVGCLFILLIANGASLYSGFRAAPFLSAYLGPVVFAGIWITIKLCSGGEWKFVDLDRSEETIGKIERLDKILYDHTETADEQDPIVNVWYNLWGVFEKMDKRGTVL